MVSIHGGARTTKDINVILDISPKDREAIEKLLECLEKVKISIHFFGIFGIDLLPALKCGES